MKSVRQTGRTTRMIQIANQYAKENPDDTIFIVSVTKEHASELAKMVEGAIPICIGESEKMLGARGKAFVDNYFYDTYDEVLRLVETVRELNSR